MNFYKYFPEKTSLKILEQFIKYGSMDHVRCIRLGFILLQKNWSPGTFLLGIKSLLTEQIQQINMYL